MYWRSFGGFSSLYESVDSNVCMEQARPVLEDHPENFENDRDR
jgi:hypothetical protein